MSARALAAALTLLALAFGGCGGDEEPRVTVLAASSLTEVLPTLEPGANYSFDGSDFLAAQVREDVPADVYLAANARYADELAADGLLEDVRVFATNRLVIVVQAGNPICDRQCRRPRIARASRRRRRAYGAGG